MGEQRIREVTMVALLFLLLGVIILLVAAGRIWIDATPSDMPRIDSTTSNNAAGRSHQITWPSAKIRGISPEWWV